MPTTSGIICSGARQLQKCYGQIRITQEFTGTLGLSDALLDSSDDNTTALTSALVLAGVGSVITAGTGTQVINEFSFDGGAVSFDAVTPGAQQTESQIQVIDNLYINGNGAVRASTPTDVNAIPQAINSSFSLLKQDDSNATLKLVDASSRAVKGNGGNSQLQDASGQVISSGKQRNIVQQGKNVAKGIYDYRVTSGPHNDGLYIGNAATQLDFLASGVDVLVLDAAWMPVSQVPERWLSTVRKEKPFLCRIRIMITQELQLSAVVISS
uniref:Putative premeiotic male-specific integral membrane protein n=1 Tax=Silene latifolia TaxID=37657 RepID=O65337_SILLA|nr:putative premeiotic male-specific integral membrane protein [Silene latifolia]